MNGLASVQVVLALCGSPLLLGIVARVKARCAGRQGPPLLQRYYDLWKLARKGAVYSRTTTWVFRASPVVVLASTVLLPLIVPIGCVPALVAFPGDPLLLVYLLGLGRFMTVLGALDTGSAFEGMGASRDVLIAALAEPALLLGLGALAVVSGGMSLSHIYTRLSLAAVPVSGAPIFVIVAAGLFIVLLTECARMPVDDPETHLELTMIHEVMVLDHGGVDLACIEYAAALKFWVLSALVAGLLVPVRTGSVLIDLLVGLGGLFAVALAVGLVESCMARLRLTRLPQLLLGATLLSLVGLILALGH